MKLNELHDAAPQTTTPSSSIQQTLREARQLVWSHRHKGIACPCCGQHCRVYKRTITSNMARWLLLLVATWRAQGGGWVAINKPPMDRRYRGGDYGKLALWGLIEAAPNTDPTKRQSGQWRPTEKGTLFADNQLTVPRYVHTYLGKTTSFSGTNVTIENALGQAFNYQDLMTELGDG